jgi:hypothetical protein
VDAELPTRHQQQRPRPAGYIAHLKTTRGDGALAVSSRHRRPARARCYYHHAVTGGTVAAAAMRTGTRWRSRRGATAKGGEAVDDDRVAAGRACVRLRESKGDLVGAVRWGGPVTG